ncbi:uncharacterized protein si:dkey-106l3.7 isoform X2 [Larimichthys crocea]|uniref:uncharacterized protein si:dkey-106l3.7 isoform X2 n=1 Tax=Larimichthys crocea TaxID=215358 RepID=UPI00054BA3BB|nr:uncharacterized protein LOC104923455 isoform X2 [Larimichthys crocea]
MNLYRSFGNLMEAWVSEGSQCLNDDDPPTPSSDTGNLRSESVDSGVETASSDASFPAISCSTDNTEIEIFTPEREDDSPTPASTSLSPVLSSPASSLSSYSSVRLCPSRAQEGSSILRQKVEQAILRTESKHLKEKPEPLTVDVVLRRRPRASFQPKQQTSGLVRGQRSESFGSRRTVDPLVHTRQICRRPMSMSCVKPAVQRRLEDLGEEEVNGLSPGLCYLEQVCQMLEEIARQQMHSQALQMEMNALQECQDSEALNACQNDFKAAEEDLSSCPRLENAENAELSSSEPQRRKNYTHFRQRSASDTTIATLHLRKLSAGCRGQHQSTDNILERVEENHEVQESKKEGVNKRTSKTWKLKIGSLGRGSSVREIWGQQMQSSEKNSARRRLSQLFRRTRRKTEPV